jgi:signal transduction histidine kinase
VAFNNFLNFWKQLPSIGVMTYLFRTLSYASAMGILWLHHIENKFPFSLFDYFVIVSFITAPLIFLFRYVQSGKKLGQLTHDCMYDFFFAGLFTGAINFSIIPSFVFSLGAATNFLASRGFHKLYRASLLPLGCLIPILFKGHYFHFESSDLILFLSLTYCLVHFIINAQILYYYNSLVKIKNDEVEKQQREIIQQAEELKTLNESLRNLNIGLEEKIHERTKELEEKNKKLEEYAFMNAHHLRAPVATIMGLIQLFDYDKTEEEAKTLIDGLKKTSFELDAAIKGIRARLEE